MLNDVYLIGALGKKNPIHYSKNRENASVLQTYLHIIHRFPNSKGVVSQRLYTVKVVFFDELAEYVNNVVEIGDHIFVKGYIGAGRYQKKTGIYPGGVSVHATIVRYLDRPRELLNLEEINENIPL